MNEKTTDNYKNLNKIIGNKKANPLAGTTPSKNKTSNTVQVKRVTINSGVSTRITKKAKRNNSGCSGCSRRKKKSG
jgi:hypothetical protein